MDYPHALHGVSSLYLPPPRVAALGAVRLCVGRAVAAALSTTGAQSCLGTARRES